MSRIRVTFISATLIIGVKRCFPRLEVSVRLGFQKVQKCGSCNCHMIESDLEGNPGGYLYGKRSGVSL